MSKHISRLAIWLGFPSVILLFSYLFSVVSSDSQISRNIWYTFEPDETFELTGSKYFIDERKDIQYYTNVPNFLQRSKTSSNSLGVKLSWDRRGSHFADITPESQRSVQGRLYQAAMWVWGGNFMHELALIFARNDGFSYGVSMGDLQFYGWRHISTGVPLVISTSSRYADAEDSFYLKNFRVYTDPRERVNNIHVFFDNFEVDEEIAFRRYDGYDIEELIRERNENPTASAPAN